jgi:hypothetical protein
VAGAEALATVEAAKAMFIMPVNTISLRLYDAVAPALSPNGAFVAVASQAGLVGEGTTGSTAHRSSP